MPLLYQQDINHSTRIGVWHIEETETFFKNIPLPQVRHPHKRLQTLAGRHLLCVLKPGFPVNEIRLSPAGRPYLEDESIRFSISHCGQFAAAVVSTECRVGVDVEAPVEKIFLIRKKFLSVAEENLLEITGAEGLNTLTMAWCIKEAVFKWYGKGGLDFRNHIQIRSFSCMDNRYHARVAFLKEDEIALMVNGYFDGKLCVAWLATPLD